MSTGDSTTDSAFAIATRDGSARCSGGKARPPGTRFSPGWVRSPSRTPFTEGGSTSVRGGRRAAVKSFLMDGRIVAGVGNIYANEALFEAGIHPGRPRGADLPGTLRAARRRGTRDPVPLNRGRRHLVSGLRTDRWRARPLPDPPDDLRSGGGTVRSLRCRPAGAHHRSALDRLVSPVPAVAFDGRPPDTPVSPGVRPASIRASAARPRPHRPHRQPRWQPAYFTDVRREGRQDACASQWRAARTERR